MDLKNILTKERELNLIELLQYVALSAGLAFLLLWLRFIDL